MGALPARSAALLPDEMCPIDAQGQNALERKDWETDRSARGCSEYYTGAEFITKARKLENAK
jgi:hypothetical protein